MIRSLRKQHRSTFTALAIALPVLFVCAIGARLDPPVMEADALASLVPPPLPETELVDSWSVGGGRAAGTIAPGGQLLRRVDGGGYLVRVVNPPTAAPDLLLYRSAAIAEGKPPIDAQLIGTVDAAAHGLPWPGERPRNGEYLLFYSLAHDEIVARVPVMVRGDSP